MLCEQQLRDRRLHPVKQIYSSLLLRFAISNPQMEIKYLRLPGQQCLKGAAN